MRFLASLLFFITIACQDSNTSTTNQQSPPSKIKTTAPIDRFNSFVEQFPTVELPYTLSALNDFSRLDNAATKQILGAIEDPEYGLDKSVDCIATFKTNDFIAILYRWTKRPLTEQAPTYFELAIYTPYGSQKSSLILGAEQQTEEFTTAFDLTIHPNFTIQTRHHTKWFISNEEKEIEQYQSFYTQGYKISNNAAIKRTKTAQLWEKIPEEFTAPFVTNYKKYPSSSSLSLEKHPNQTILTGTTQEQQLIIAPISLPNFDTVYLVSSLNVEPDNALNDSFYIHSKLALIQLNSSNLTVVTNQLIDSSEWEKIYAAIQKTCNCQPSPYVNKAGIVGLTMLETNSNNAAYATLQPNNEIIFQCRQKGIDVDSIAYRLSLNPH